MAKYRGEKPVIRGSKNNLTHGAFGSAKEFPEVKNVNYRPAKKARPARPIALRRIPAAVLVTSKYTPGSTKPLAKRAGYSTEGMVDVRLDAQG